MGVRGSVGVDRCGHSLEGGERVRKLSVDDSEDEAWQQSVGANGVWVDGGCLGGSAVYKRDRPVDGEEHVGGHLYVRCRRAPGHLTHRC